MISVQTEDFTVGAEYDSLRGRIGDTGAIVTFTGLVREFYGNADDGAGKIQALHLEHYPGMTEKSLAAIVDAAGERWELLATRVIHRTGCLRPSEQIVFVGVAAAHRRPAFDAACYIMDYLKSEAPFWKKQETASGGEWVKNRRSDAEAIARWQQKSGSP